jgi:hypothetical protein
VAILDGMFADEVSDALRSLLATGQPWSNNQAAAAKQLAAIIEAEVDRRVALAVQATAA